MELVVFCGEFAPESFDVESVEHAWRVVGLNWSRWGEYAGSCFVYAADGRLLESRDWCAGEDVDRALWGW